MKDRIAPLLLGVLILVVIGTSTTPSPLHAQPTGDSSDMMILIQRATTELHPRQPKIEVDVAGDSTATYWIGQALLAVSGSDIDSVTVLNSGSDTGGMTERAEKPLVVHVAPDVGQAYATVTEESVGGHLAFSVLGEVTAVPKVLEPWLGGRIVLYGVDDQLRSRFIDAVQGGSSGP